VSAVPALPLDRRGEDWADGGGSAAIWRRCLVQAGYL